MKRILNICLVFCAIAFCVTLIPFCANAAVTEEGLKYTVANDEVTISDYNGSATELVIPETIEGHPVTSIRDYAFSYCEDLTSIFLPSSITSIGECAFYNCSKLRGVYITDLEAWCNITFGDHYANPLWAAKKLYLDDTLITNLVIPQTVIAINDYAFYNCSNLTSVTIPDSIASIGGYAFYNCVNLSQVFITDLEAWCDISFSDHYANPLWAAKKLYLDDTLITNLVIPQTVIAINDYAFYNCSGLTSVTIPNSIASIGNSAFSDCSGLIDINIPDSVTSIGDYAFSGCSSLQCNTYDNGKYLGNSNNPYLFFVEAINKAITTCKIYPNTRFIGQFAFYDCSSLTDITLPDSITHIGMCAFSGCSRLININLPGSVTSIGLSVFSGCSNLTDITIPNGVTNIGSSMFYNCNSLTDITIPDSVTSIGEEAFAGCSSLTNVTIPDGVTRIGSLAFSCCENLINISIPDSVEYVGCEAFYDSENLQYNIYDNAIYLGNSNNLYVVLISCANDSITSCTIHPDAKIICDSAFSYCKNLTSITIPASVKMIGVGAFSNCYNLSFCNITDIAAWCNIFFDVQLGISNPLDMAEFVYVQGELLTELVIPKDVTTIKNYVFYGCDSISSIKFNGDAPDIASSAFYGITATAYYPIGNDSWTEEVMQDYGGDITWVPYEALEPGDLDGVEGVDNRDVEFLLWYTLFPEDYPLPQEADFDSDGAVDNKDVEYLLWHTLFPEDYPISKSFVSKKKDTTAVN